MARCLPANDIEKKIACQKNMEVVAEVAVAASNKFGTGEK